MRNSLCRAVRVLTCELHRSEHAIIRMDYGNIAIAQRNGDASFYSRRITLPIITTVQQTLRCRSLDIQHVDQFDVSLSATPSLTPGQSQRSRVASARMTPRHQSSFRNDRASQDHLQNALSSACNQPDFCIASALFTNPSDQALEVCLERRREGDGGSCFEIFANARPNLSDDILQKP